jgi:hypothetical protein
MIGVEGQYIASFTLGEMKDFLKEEQLICFKIIEDTGNILPIFQLDIYVWDEKILKYANEGKELIISLGKSRNELTDSKFRITKSIPVRDGEHKIILHMVGIYAAMSYITDKKIKISDKKPSIDVMREVITKHTNLTFSTNISSTQDSMYWIQPNISDKKFINNIWTHTYIPNSFPALGTTILGEFRYRDINQLAKETPKFTFKIAKKEDKKPNEIIYELPYNYTNSSTFNNQVYAYGKEKLIANLEAGDFTLLTQEPINPTLAMSKDGMTDKEIKPRYDEHSNQSADNVHANFWKAKLQNLVNLFTFSTVKLTLMYTHDFHDIHVLDLVYFKEEETNANRKYSSETITGLYVITKVSRVIEKKVFKTFVEMCRETPNAIRIRNEETKSMNVVTTRR